MAKIKIESTDYQKLVKIAKGNTNQAEAMELNIIEKRYSIKNIINNIKVALFADVKKHKEGTDENKRAYNKYQDFKKFTDNLTATGINDNSLTYEMLENVVKEHQLHLQADVLQV